jgi:cytochrome c-type biogenesis protein CcmH
MRCLLLVSLLLLQPLAAMAEPLNAQITPEERIMAMPAAQQEQAHMLWNRLRCVVCSGQSVAQSQAPLARDIRLRVVEALESGQTPAEIEANLAQRYGDSILLSPPEDGSGMLLWLAPLLFLIAGIGLLIRRMTHQPKAPQ